MDNYLRKTMQTTLKNKGTSDEIFMNISNESEAYFWILKPSNVMQNCLWCHFFLI